MQQGPSSPQRPVAAVLAAVALGAFGAVILGEQPLRGTTVAVAAVLLGLAVAEVIAAIARGGDVYLIGSAALIAQAAMVWALYIETGHRLDLAAPEAWVATVAAAAVAAGRLRSAARRGRRSPESPSHTPVDEHRPPVR